MARGLAGGGGGGGVRGGDEGLAAEVHVEELRAGRACGPRRAVAGVIQGGEAPASCAALRCRCAYALCRRWPRGR